MNPAQRRQTKPIKPYNAELKATRAGLMASLDKVITQAIDELTDLQETALYVDPTDGNPDDVHLGAVAERLEKVSTELSEQEENIESKLDFYRLQ